MLNSFRCYLSIGVFRIAILFLLGSTIPPAVFGGEIASYRGTGFYRETLDSILTHLGRPAPETEAEKETLWKNQILDFFLLPEMVERVGETFSRGEGERVARQAELYTEWIIGKAVAARFMRDATVTDEQVETYYRDHLASFRQPAGLKFQHIFVRVGPYHASPEEAEAKIQEAHALLLEGLSFDSVAENYSDAGGVKTAVIYRDTYMLSVPFQEALAPLNPGEFSRPFTTPHGWQIVRLVQKIPEGYRSLEEVAEDIRDDTLLPEIKSQRLNHLNERVEAEVPLDLFQEVLENESAESDAIVARFGEREITRAIALEWIAEREKEGGFSSDRFSEKVEYVLRLIANARMKEYARVTGLLNEPEIRAASDGAWFLQVRPWIHYLFAMESWTPPDESFLREVYRENLDRFGKPILSSGRVIEIGPSPGENLTPAQLHFALEDAHREGEKLLESIRAGEITFEEAAIGYSRLSNAPEGGYLPLAASHGFLFDTRTQPLQPGEFTDLVEMNDGVAIFLLEERIEPPPYPFEEVRDKVVEMIFEEHRERAISRERERIEKDVIWIAPID